MVPTRKNELLADHRPDAIALRLGKSPRSQFVSPAVLGGIDGCISTFAIVSASVGAGFTSTVALILGFANLLADGFSMGASNYESAVAERQHANRLRRLEEEHIESVPGGEREEVRQLFEKKGFHGETLAQIVETITADRKLWINTMLTEEHGLPKTVRRPITSGVVTFVAFILVGSVPLLSFLIPGEQIQTQYIRSTIIAGLMFFVIGAAKAYCFKIPMVEAGVRTLLTGGLAAGLAFASGHYLQQAFGI